MIAEANVHRARAAYPNGTGALVVAGSSGRLDVDRADGLAARGVSALALRWFGGEGQPSVPCEIPLETFTDAVAELVAECDRVVLIGLSYGAEAALLTATIDGRVDGVVALAPTDVAWEGQHQHDSDPRRSKWTHDGRPVPFVPLDRTWQPPPGVPAYVGLYLRSRGIAGPEVVEAATIRIEEFTGELVLVAGGDDQVWPSAPAARAITARRARAGLGTVLVEDPRAGHPVVLPGERASDAPRPYQVGGDAGAARRLGALAWPAISSVLRIRQPD